MLIPTFDYGSYLAYSPRGSALSQKESRNVMRNLKRENAIGDPPCFMSDVIARKIHESIAELPFRDFFGKDVALVPIPRSSLMKKDSLWVSDKVVRALVNNGMGVHYPCLERFRAVPKSAYSLSEDRPKPADHFYTIRVRQSLGRESQFYL